MTLRNSLLFPCLGLFAFGCKSTPAVSSDDLATHGMSMEVHALADDNHTELRVKLWAGDADKQGTLVNLSPSDQLMLTAPTTQAFGAVGSEGQGTIYGLNLGALDATTFSIDLKRTKAASALANTVQLPKAFTLKKQTKDSFSRKEMITFEWDRADGSHTMSIEIKGDCIERWSKTLTGDPGTYVVNAGELKPFSTTDADKTCPVNVVVTRELDNGQFSAEFGHVSVGYASQIRGYTINSAP
jgi:hypothetical protein